MPKARIKDARIPQGANSIPGWNTAAPVLSVRWTKPDAPRSQQGNDISPLLDPLCITYDRLDPDFPEVDQWGGFFVLDREGCNRLIRALRQARNDVYGRDE